MIETPVVKTRKKKKFKWDKLLGISIFSLTSGLWFGIGYTIIDHADSAWLQTKDADTSAKVATANNDN
jgi:hypothetical protein